VKPSTGANARARLHILREQILTREETWGNTIVVHNIGDVFKDKYAEERNASTADVNELINRMAGAPNCTTETMKLCVLKSPNLQVYLLDRFRYAEQYLEQVGGKEYLEDELFQDFLRRCLIDLWSSRERKGVWA